MTIRWLWHNVWLVRADWMRFVEATRSNLTVTRHDPPVLAAEDQDRGAARAA